MRGNGAIQMNPYLSFKGECEAAFKLYERCLGGFGIHWLINCEGDQPPNGGQDG